MRFDKLVTSILFENNLYESMDSSYNIKKPNNFSEATVFYTFETRDGIEISVQFTNEYQESVLSPDNNILLVFGRRKERREKTSNWMEGSWIEVEVEELLNVRDRLQILSTVRLAVLDFIKKFFSENDESTELTINFYGSLTDEEDQQGKNIDQSKRSNIYKKMFRGSKLLYNLELYTDKEGRLVISNS